MLLKVHKYAIDDAGQHYPVKQIVSLASGVPVAKFSGGVAGGHANHAVEELGFSVVPLHERNPDWTRDELILALDLYIRHRPTPPAKDSKEVLELSGLRSRVDST